MDDLVTQQFNAARQRKLADLLRAKAEGTPNYTPNEGRMVAGRYLAPSWSQNLSSLINPMMQQRRAGEQEALANEQESAYNQATQQARQQWQSQLPQAIAAKAAQHTLPEDQEGPSIPEQPAQPVSTAQIFKHALAGGNIPGNEKAAELYMKGAMSDQAREDTQIFRTQEAREARAQRSADLAATLAQRADAAKYAADRTLEGTKERAEALRYAANLRADVSRFAAQARYDAAIAKNEAAAKAKGLKPVPQKVMKELTDLSDRTEAMTEINADYRPEYAGAKGALNKFTGTWVPGTDSASANWWKDYNNRASLIERHQLFGTALSAGERAAWQEATISPGMTDAVIAKNLATRARIAKKMYNEGVRRQEAASAGNYSVLDVFQPIEDTPAQSPAQAPAQPAAQPSAQPKRLKFNPATGQLE